MTSCQQRAQSGATSSPGGEVVATRFVLVGDNGKERAVLEMDGSQPSLKLLDAGGHVKLNVRLNEHERGSIAILNGNGEPRMLLEDRGGEMMLGLHDGSGKCRALATVTDKIADIPESRDPSGAMILLSDGRRNPRVGLADAGGKSSVWLSDPRGERVRLVVEESNGTYRSTLKMCDEYGRVRAAMGGSAAWTGLMLLDENDRPMFVQPQR